MTKIKDYFMMKDRGFEIAKGFEDKEINLPKRSTEHAAGYDFEAAETVTIPSMIELVNEKGTTGSHQAIDPKRFKPVLVPTGIKAYMGAQEYLQLANRSSNPLKRFLYLGNGIGVIDSDYYENDSNDGHIMFQFINLGPTAITIEKGEKIGQGVFLPYLMADNDFVDGHVRTGGFGSTGK